jgi:hypothetical protein
MICYIDKIDTDNRINWRCQVWDRCSSKEEDSFKKMYKEYIGEDFPRIKIINRTVVERGDFIEKMNKLTKNLNELTLYSKDKRIKEHKCILRNFIGDISCNHYIFDVIREGE